MNNNSNTKNNFRALRARDPELEAACTVAVRDSLKIKPEERVLIITNPEEEVYSISLGLYDAVLAAGGRPALLVQQPKTQLDFAEDAVNAAIASEPEVIISMSAEKLGKDAAAQRNPILHEGVYWDKTFEYLLHGKKSVRSFWSPKATRDMFRRTVPVDYGRMRRECVGVKKLLDAADKVHITNKKGCDLWMGLSGRTAFEDNGDLSLPGTGGNLPAGETFISPALGLSEGLLVFDGSIAAHEGEIIIREPIRCEVKKGFITAITGGTEARALLESITLGEEKARLMEKEGQLGPGVGETYAANARHLGELGIGLNPMARITGRILEDEKAYRTCHIAVGKNYNEDANALIHLDGLITEPTIELFFTDGSRHILMELGDLRL